ncbi:G-D-S-L family lipolytic protein [Flavobacteriaceae bacterium TP-CH-4]|uniref:G-D-S-L family lipolytic protein n=1 Tax=Pelagihabitans pacificus TaxID=2696054 RepID=A0A967AQ52_9FLAO|nr:G-D-S-L family lipolytic protein [Pelagihabitans pacificus]NHF58298.1 G-D-S-L family lipolytic protein [Pelagihabitans pacificus]
MKKILALSAFFGFLLISCSDDDTPVVTPDPMMPVPENFSAGSADFSNFVSLGNSLTAGYSDEALFIDGQNASMPNMMATSFSAVGGGAFTIPLMADNLGGLTLGGAPLEGFGNRRILSFATGDPDPVRVEGAATTEVSNILAGPFNNMGVPGAKSFHLAANGYGSLDALAVGAANPYYVRFASSPTASIIEDALAQNPSFFSLWIGNNDILSYATSGGAGVDQEGNLDPTTYGNNDITDPSVFASVYNDLLLRLTANGAKGVVANIPDVTTIPYFTRIPFAPLDPTNPDFGPQIPTLNANFAQLNGVFEFLGVPERAITFSESGASAIVIKDESLTDLSDQITQVLLANGADAGTAAVTGFLYGQARQATAADLIVLTARNEIATLNEEAFATLQQLGLPAAEAGQLAVNGVTYPMEDQWVLTSTEQAAVQAATDKFNSTISTLAQVYDLAFVDAKAFLEVVAQTGITLADGSVVTATYATGGGFSLDGVHPAPRGYALLANEFLKAIEEQYGATLPDVNPLEYTGLYIQ